ncbi:protein-glutamate methylesterase [Mycobacterium paraense]|uniref:protein-glutamate methylesterase n=1 Tax=Mycobacterium paraense TaxID=767916 RepID=A0A1X2A7F5_9MYCO|nr:chemotaxis protein CheB [Mycobacterium paraense]MCV7444349.1 chemotaxis protein CheB [Mycobacterium paraense]ORW31206.1 protein-glutamate methylesterase [Mycobacterium paraense]ORW36148.1 protein-glutamate methylesterase [Mycobacterium paraense]ORW43210.1 protein-glutamate methylesterase [Mycobacterium paraense]ORW44589.1 protein-glutamate methylesterase [Mycobacterium paraense]
MVIDATNEENGLRGVVAIGASAGGVEALSRLAAGLSADLPYAYLMVLHVPAGAPSVLARIVDRSGPLPAMAAKDGEPLEPGHIYVGRPDRHLLVADHRLMLSQGPTENGHRPAINALFRSVAVTFGPRAVGVLLSGVLDDGVLGLGAIRSRGGTTIGQAPEDALFAALPTNARDAGVLDRQATAAEIGAVLKELSQKEIKETTMEPDAALELENRIAMASRFATDFDTQELGAPSGYTCPDCNGSLISITEGHFRCQVGHAWTADALLAARDDEVDGALWIALRSLQEKVRLARRMAGRVGDGPLSRHYNNLADESERALSVLSERLAANAPERGDASA